MEILGLLGPGMARDGAVSAPTEIMLEGDELDANPFDLLMELSAISPPFTPAMTPAPTVIAHAPETDPLQEMITAMTGISSEIPALNSKDPMVEAENQIVEPGWVAGDDMARRKTGTQIGSAMRSDTMAGATMLSAMVDPAKKPPDLQRSPVTTDEFLPAGQNGNDAASSTKTRAIPQERAVPMPSILQITPTLQAAVAAPQPARSDTMTGATMLPAMVDPAKKPPDLQRSPVTTPVTTDEFLAQGFLPAGQNGNDAASSTKTRAIPQERAVPMPSILQITPTLQAAVEAPQLARSDTMAGATMLPAMADPAKKPPDLQRSPVTTDEFLAQGFLPAGQNGNDAASSTKTRAIPQERAVPMPSILQITPTLQAAVEAPQPAQSAQGGLSLLPQLAGANPGQTRFTEGQERASSSGTTTISDTDIISISRRHPAAQSRLDIQPDSLQPMKPSERPPNVTQMTESTPFHAERGVGSLQYSPTDGILVSSSSPSQHEPRGAMSTSASVIRQIADAVITSRDDTVEITLSPEELGRVRMVLTGHERAPHFSIWAERPEILEQLRRNSDTLLQNLNDEGMQDATLSFQDERRPRADGQEETGQRSDEQPSLPDNHAAREIIAPGTAEGTGQPHRLDVRV